MVEDGGTPSQAQGAGDRFPARYGSSLSGHEDGRVVKGVNFVVCATPETRGERRLLPAGGRRSVGHARHRGYGREPQDPDRLGQAGSLRNRHPTGGGGGISTLEDMEALFEVG